MKKVIWLINQYATTPEIGMGGRHYYLAKELASQGHSVYLISASFSHLMRKYKPIIYSYETENVDGFKFVKVKVLTYSRPQSKIRILNWFLFSWKLRKINLEERPDVVLYSSPGLIGFLGAKSIARKFNSKLIFEVRDIWPLTLINLGGFSSKHPFIRFLQYVEDKAYAESDYVISNLKYAVDHMKNRGMNEEKFRWIPNGFSLEEFTKQDELDKKVEEMISEKKFWIGYTGTLGLANSLDVLIDAAKILGKMEDIKFAILGNGSAKEALKEKARNYNLKNVIFIDSIPKKQIPSFLQKMSACYIGWMDQPLYQYGIGANKIPEYLYSGKPVIHSYSGKGDLVAEYNAGLVCSSGDANLLSLKITELYNMTDEEREKLGRNGRNAALKHLEYGKIAKNFSALFKN